MTKPRTTIDCEIHLLHPKAQRADFLPPGDEPAFNAVHKHASFEHVKNKLTVESLLHSMDQNGIELAIIMGMSWLDVDTLNANNEYIAEMVSRYPDRFRGLFIPHLGDCEKAAASISKIDSNIFVGAKVLPGWQGVHVDDERFALVANAVRARDMLIMIHTDHATQSLDGDTPSRFYHFLRKNPELRVLAPHLGGLICLYGMLPSVREVLRNTTFITSVSATMAQVKFAAEVNSANIAFGSDFPFNHCHNHETMLESLSALGLSDEVLHRISYSNAARILNERP